jgi:hypothetical protein
MNDRLRVVKGVCGNNFFTLFTTDCVFQHRLIQYLVIELFRFYNEDTVANVCCQGSAEDDDENNQAWSDTWGVNTSSMLSDVL